MNDIFDTSSSSGSLPSYVREMSGELLFMDSENEIILKPNVRNFQAPSYKLSPGMPITVLEGYNNDAYAGVLDYQDGWTITGTGLHGRELDEIYVHIPVYVMIQQEGCAGYYDLENPFTPNNECNAGIHSFKCFDMNFRQAAALHIDGILKLLEKEARWPFKIYADYLFNKAGDIGPEALEFIRKSWIDALQKLPGINHKARIDIISDWFHNELARILIPKDAASPKPDIGASGYADSQETEIDGYPVPESNPTFYDKDGNRFQKGPIMLDSLCFPNGRTDYLAK